MCTDLNGYFGSQSSFSSRGSNVETLSGLNAWFRMLTKKILRPEEGFTDRGKNYLWTSISNFEALRDLGRHTGHIMEVEQVAIETMDKILAQQESNFKELQEGLSKTYRIRAREYLAFQLQLMRSLKWRTNSTIDRLGEEQTLAYNRLASSDNNIMKSITILTMIFLPATFISVSAHKQVPRWDEICF
ncbi:hypothetical protein ESCO_006517 [Escovopsis weberi]|uniref:Uncharacterized protein n=1 Tax=Escovopsis weberi TaxID=150374 RepID=A0A0M8MZ31_ESCWE|nr:hypothetical protein ESCO_006517 [Escovopsis weberi]